MGYIFKKHLIIIKIPGIRHAGGFALKDRMYNETISSLLFEIPGIRHAGGFALKDRMYNETISSLLFEITYAS